MKQLKRCEYGWVCVFVSLLADWTHLHTLVHHSTQLHTIFIVTWFAHSSTLVMFHLCTFPSNVVPAYISSIICVEMSYHRALMHGWLILCGPVQWTEFVYTCTVGCVCAQFALSLHSVCTQFALSLHTVAHSCNFRFVSIRKVQSEQLSRTSKCLVLINLRVLVVSHNFPENRAWLKGFPHTLPTLDQSLVIMLQRFPLLAWSLLLGAGCVLLEYSCNSIWRTCLQ